MAENGAEKAIKVYFIWGASTSPTLYIHILNRLSQELEFLNGDVNAIA